MAKLIFRYGAMGSSKTANALMVRYNYYDMDIEPDDIEVADTVTVVWEIS